MRGEPRRHGPRPLREGTAIRLALDELRRAEGGWVPLRELLTVANCARFHETVIRRLRRDHGVAIECAVLYRLKADA